MKNLSKRDVKALNHWDKWREVSHSLSFQEMMDYLGTNAGVLPYHVAFPTDVSLKEKLRRYPWRAVVFLYRSSPTYGHYVVCWEHKDRLFVFDSYGGEPDSWGKYLSKSARERLEQTMPLLLQAVESAGYDGIEWNQYPFQALVPQVATCGRWALARLWKRNLGVEGFKKWVFDECRRLELPPDIWVTYLTLVN